MSNDAKLGLVVGVAIVVVIALVFFRSDPLEAKGNAEPAPATTAVQKPPPPQTFVPPERRE